MAPLAPSFWNSNSACPVSYTHLDVYKRQVQILGGPEIDELHGVARAADPVDTPKTLDDADGIPVNVVVDQGVAVLKVLAFANAIGGDQEVDFTLLRQSGNLGAVFSSRGKISENLVVSARAEGGAGGAAAADQGQVDAEFLARPVEQRFIEICGSVCKRGKDQDFPVRLALFVGCLLYTSSKLGSGRMPWFFALSRLVFWSQTREMKKRSLVIWMAMGWISTP